MKRLVMLAAAAAFLLPAVAQAAPSSFGPAAKCDNDGHCTKAGTVQSASKSVQTTRQMVRGGEIGARRASAGPRLAAGRGSVLGGRPSDCTQRGRPIAWCGCWMAKHLNMARNFKGLNLDQARGWLGIGTPVSSPGTGDLVIWTGHHNHVAQVTGPGSRPDTRMMISGNDSKAVRERERSIRGASYRSLGGARLAFGG